MSWSTRSEPTDLVSWTLSGDYDSERLVLIDAENPQRFISKRIAVDLTAKLAGYFAGGSTVCLHMGNDILYPVLVLAIYASQCRWTGTNTAYTARELEHHFRISETRYVITTVEQLGKVQDACRECGNSPEIIVFSDLLAQRSTDQWAADTSGTRNALRTLHDLLHPGDETTLRAALKPIKQSEIAAVFSTSGTTGLPKMAARTHKAMQIETRAIEDNNRAKDYEVRRLYCTPIFHGFSAPEMLCNALRLGQTTYFMKRFDERLFPEYIWKYGITETAAPPPMLLKLVNNPNAYHQIQSLRAVFTGGASLAPELKSRFCAIFQRPPRVVQVWGMTEGGWFTTLKYPEDDSTGSVGRILPGYDVRIDHSEQTQVADGKHAGEIQVKGPFVMENYLGNDEATRNAFRGRWLRTGDIGYIEDGRVFLIDRAKDLIKVNGWQVSPAEIEDALLKHDQVQDAAVIGAGRDTNEHPLAFVVRRLGSVTTDTIKAHLSQHLTRYKIAQCEVKFINAIPKSASGKILKNELRKLEHTVCQDRFHMAEQDLM